MCGGVEKETESSASLIESNIKPRKTKTLWANGRDVLAALSY
jgi:hypothetical protein